MLGPLLLLIYFHLGYVVFWGLKTQKTWVRWLFILYPPAWMIFLFWIPFDILQTIFWGPAAIAFIISVFSLLFQFSRIFYRGIKKKEQVPYFMTRLIRPVLTTVLFLSAAYLLKLSLFAADQYAVKKAKEIQEKVKIEGKCQPCLEEWPKDSMLYGRYGTKHPITYHVPYDDPNKFIIEVRHSIDDRLYVEGGVGRDLEVYVMFDSGKIEKNINDY